MSNVDHPPHYQHPSGVEAIDICEHLGFNLGNAYKHLVRAGKKGPVAEDLRKAAWYLRRAAEGMTNGGRGATHAFVPRGVPILARRVMVAGVAGCAHRMMLLAISDGAISADDCESVRRECEREAAAAESAQ